MKNSFKILISVICLVGCEPNTIEISQNPYTDWARNHPGLQVANLPEKKGNWQTRFYPLDKERLETLGDVNAIDGITEVPRPTSDFKTYETRLIRVAEILPNPVKKILEKYLYGIYFVQGLGSTGLTGIVRGKNKEPLGGILFLDTDYLQKPINDWATEKDGSAFQTHESLSLKLSEENSNIQTLKFIILHELGHILATVLNHAPDYSETYRDYRKFPIFEGVWITETISPYDQTFFPERNSIRFYKKHANTKLFPDGYNIYKKLKNTSFVSLYAATNADDTYAEAFAQYVTVVLEKEDYIVKINANGKEEEILKNPILLEGGRRFRILFEKVVVENKN
ncbi:hypothetical protein P3G55_05290 [Leptospira sp. 96542]|nr:hypothetical protein [Leptospira sp. 96542]